MIASGLDYRLQTSLSFHTLIAFVSYMCLRSDNTIQICEQQGQLVRLQMMANDGK